MLRQIKKCKSIYGDGLCERGTKKGEFMKTLVIISALLLSTSAFAKTVVGSVYFKGSSAYVPANYLCINDGYIVKKNGNQTTKKVYCKNDNTSSCEFVTVALIAQPVVDTFTRCDSNEKVASNHDCDSTAVEYNSDQSSVPVYDVQKSGDSESYNIVGSYSIPACASGQPVPAL
jgi:hypothetical protein